MPGKANKNKSEKAIQVIQESIADKIYLVRGNKVMFALTGEGLENLRSQIATASNFLLRWEGCLRWQELCGTASKLKGMNSSV